MHTQYGWEKEKLHGTLSASIYIFLVEVILTFCVIFIFYTLFCTFFMLISTIRVDIAFDLPFCFCLCFVNVFFSCLSISLVSSLQWFTLKKLLVLFILASALSNCNCILFALQYVLEELNVRSLVPCNDTLKYASLRAEPEFRYAFHDFVWSLFFMPVTML